MLKQRSCAVRCSPFGPANSAGDLYSILPGPAEARRRLRVCPRNVIAPNASARFGLWPGGAGTSSRRFFPVKAGATCEQVARGVEMPASVPVTIAVHAALGAHPALRYRMRCSSAAHYHRVAIRLSVSKTAVKDQQRRSKPPVEVYPPQRSGECQACQQLVGDVRPAAEPRRCNEPRQRVAVARKTGGHAVVRRLRQPPPDAVCSSSPSPVTPGGSRGEQIAAARHAAAFRKLGAWRRPLKRPPAKAASAAGGRR